MIFILDDSDGVISTVSATDSSGDNWEPKAPVYSTGSDGSDIAIINGIPCVLLKQVVNPDWDWNEHRPKPGELVFGAYY